MQSDKSQVRYWCCLDPVDGKFPVFMKDGEFVTCVGRKASLDSGRRLAEKLQQQEALGSK